MTRNVTNSMPRFSWTGVGSMRWPAMLMSKRKAERDGRKDVKGLSCERAGG